MGKGWCKECETEIALHADGTLICGCTSIDANESLPDHWTRQDELEEARIKEVR